MSDEWIGVNLAQEDLEEPVWAVGRSFPVRLITLLSATMAIGMAACTSEETLTEPSGEVSPARAAVKPYTAVDLGTLGGASSKAAGINSAGQVVGSSTTAQGETHAFLWDKGVMTDLGTLGGNWSEATGINDAGQVVGWNADDFADPQVVHAFLWEKGVMTDLGTLFDNFSQAADINPGGQVVGYSRHAFLWEKGVMTDMGTLGGFSSRATAISPAGQVVGTSDPAGLGEGRRAFLWSKGVMTDLGTLGRDAEFGTTYSEAADINAAGQVVGWSQPPGETFGAHAFLWEKGVMTDLGTLGGIESASEALAINAAAQVVGLSTTATDPRGEWHIFFWEKGVMTDLGTLGGPLGRISAINPAGQFVGWRQIVPGVTHATLWTRK